MVSSLPASTAPNAEVASGGSMNTGWTCEASARVPTPRPGPSRAIAIRYQCDSGDINGTREGDAPRYCSAFVAPRIASSASFNVSTSTA